jgi:hypothetical protein
MGVDGLVAGVIVALAFAPPAIAAFRHLGHGLRLTERVLLAVALAPLALALPALALALLAHLPVARCLLPVVFNWTVIALWPRRRKTAAPPGEPLPERGHGFPAIAAILTAVGTLTLVGAVALTVPMANMGGDAWFHATAAIEVGLRGVPPQDPNFAGVPFFYPWFFHFLLALLSTANRVSPFAQMALINAWAAVVLVLAASQLAYRAFGRAAAMWAGAIVVLGLDPFGWIFAIVRALQGEAGGFANAVAQLGSGSGAGAMLSYRFPPSHVSTLGWLWTGGPLMPAIALGVAATWSVARALEHPSRMASVRALLLALAAFAFHPAYAAIALACVGAGLIWVAMIPERRGTAVALLAVLGMAFVAAIAYFRACSVPGAAAAVQLGFYSRNLGSLLLAVGPWWLIAAPAFRALRGDGAAGRLCVAAALVAMVSALTVVLPRTHSDKLFSLAWVSLAPLLAAGWVWWGNRLRLPTVARLALITLLMVPTAGLYALGTAMDQRSPGLLIRGDTPANRQLPLVTKGEEEGYNRIRVYLPEDAVVIERPRPTVNEPVPILGGRPVFCGALDVQLTNQSAGGRLTNRAAIAVMEEFQVRRGIQDALFESGVLDETQHQYLEKFAAPVYLMVRRNEVPDAVWFGFMAQPDWAEDYGGREIRIFRLKARPVGL